MSYKNFKFDVDADGIALVTWDMPGKSMNVIDQSVTEELSQIVDKVASDAAIRGAVVTSGKDTFSGGADLTMLQGLGKAFTDMAKSKGETAAMQLFFDEFAKAVSRFPQAREIRKTLGRRDQWHCDGRCF